MKFANFFGVTEGDILNGVSTTSEKYLSENFADLLSKCSPEKSKLIYNIAKMIVEGNV